MKRFVTICFIGILITVCSLVGVKIFNVPTQEKSSTQGVTLVTPPEEYDLRDYIHIEVENQHNFGICYAFASLTSLETYLALNYNEYYDFSEIHFASSLYFKDKYYLSANDALVNGGNFAHFSLYTQKDKSIVPEELMPIENYTNLSTSVRESKLASDYNNVSNNFYSLVKVNETKTYSRYVGNKQQYSSSELEYFRKQVKNHIMNYGAVTAGIHSGNSLNSRTTSYRVMDDSLVTNESTINQNIDHLISIVGWDDNYNANGAWENKGAYICLNSWGTSFGYNGYFYVSYDDYFVESTIQGVSNATLCTTTQKISPITKNQDKTTIYTHVFDEAPTIYFADILYTADHIGENITHIDSYVEGSTTKFFIQFFNSYDTALASINTSYHQANATKVDNYTLYTKYQLNSPIAITGNYALIVREVADTVRTRSLSGYTSDNLNLGTTYYQGDGVRSFIVDSNKWDPVVETKQLDSIIPVVLYTDKQYVKVSPFESNASSVIYNRYVKSNATFMNKRLNLTINNVTLNNDTLNNITIKRLFTNNPLDVTSQFNFELSGSTITFIMANEVSSLITEGQYLISIPCGDTVIYRIIQVQDAVSFTIEYFLDGGEANNPTVYTNQQYSLTLNSPVKAGYEFVGWYTDSDFTTEFNPNNLPYTNLKLYAKYDFASPTILIKSSDISITYYDGLNVMVSVVASHPLVNEYNTLTYQWYYRSNNYGMFYIVSGANNSKLILSNVNQSGYYACEVSINITEPALTATPCTKTLNVSASNAIAVNIKPYIYDMSKVVWDYTEPFSYDTKNHTVQLLNLPSGVTASYTNNSASNIGTYTAIATLNYDNMDGNAIASPVDNLTWKIRKAKITITINNITSQTMLTQAELDAQLSCNITSEYMPSNLNTLEDKIAYLNLKYNFTQSSNMYVKTISATTDSFDIYDITILNGEYRVVVYSLNSNSISTTSKKGFVQDCTFSASSQTLTANDTTLIKQNDLEVVSSYNFEFSYLKNDIATITIPVERKQLLNGLSVYMLKDGKLTKLNSSVSNNTLSFETSEENATYIVVHDTSASVNNTQILTLIIISGIYIALFAGAIINNIKRKRQNIRI